MEGCDRNKMEETKSGLRKTVEEHNFLLGDFQQNVDTTAKCLEIQLTKEIETLRSTKQTFVEDLVQLKAAKESQVKAVESLGLKVSKETKTLFNLKKQTRAWQEKARQNTLALKSYLSEQHHQRSVPTPTYTPAPAQSGQTSQALPYPQVRRPSQAQAASYSHNPMPNFNFPAQYSSARCSGTIILLSSHYINISVHPVQCRARAEPPPQLPGPPPSPL